MAEAANVDRVCVKQFQEVFHSRQSVRTSSALNEDGKKLSNSAKVVARWCSMFLYSQFSQECVDRMSSLKVHADLDDPSGEEEFESALGKGKLRKTGDTSRIVPEMVVFGGPVLHQVLCLFRRVWRELLCGGKQCLGWD